MWLSCLLLPLLLLHTSNLVAVEPGTALLEDELQYRFHLLTLALLVVMIISSITVYIYRVNRKLRHLLVEQQRNDIQIPVVLQPEQTVLYPWLAVKITGKLPEPVGVLHGVLHRWVNAARTSE